MEMTFFGGGAYIGDENFVSRKGSTIIHYTKTRAKYFFRRFTVVEVSLLVKYTNDNNSR